MRVLDFAQKHKSLLGNIRLIIFILCFTAHDTKANIEDARVNAEEPRDTAWSRDEEGSGYTLAGWERAAGARPNVPRHGIRYQAWPTVGVGWMV